MNQRLVQTLVDPEVAGLGAEMPTLLFEGAISKCFEPYACVRVRAHTSMPGGGMGAGLFMMAYQQSFECAISQMHLEIVLVGACV